MRTPLLALPLVVALSTAGAAQTKAPAPVPAPAPAPSASAHDHRAHQAPTDSAFAATQARGKGVMGVDQYTSTHVFESLPDGGRIVLQRDDADPVGEATIRTHMRDIQARFTRGDFSLPGVVHAMAEVPGTKVMTARRRQIRYRVESLRRGAQLRIVTKDPEAIKAIHQFLAFQRLDHRAAGHAP